jgi:hypothetical protein
MMFVIVDLLLATSRRCITLTLYLFFLYNSIFVNFVKLKFITDFFK